MPARRTPRERIAATMFVLAAVLAAGWLANLLGGWEVNANTLVLTAPPDPNKGYLSHLRGFRSQGGSLWLWYVRADYVRAWADKEKDLRFSFKNLDGGGIPMNSRLPQWLERLGFGWYHTRLAFSDPAQGPYVSREANVAVPYWLLIVLLGGGGWWIGRKPRLMRRRGRRGLCPNCGYDLRGSSGRCPECGFDLAPAADSQRPGLSQPLAR